MRIFSCAHCGQMIYFENTHCEHCGYEFGFNHETLSLETLKSNGYNGFFDYNSNLPYQYCSNHQYSVCNWIVPAGNPNQFCTACQLNKTIPNIASPHNIELWKLIEKAKHRLLYSLYKLKLPLVSKYDDAINGLAFDFLENHGPNERVITGHSDGLITINIEEADDVFREAERKKMGEPYRTLLGHFRHEVGHYYWTRLIENNDSLLYEFRQIFGNEQRDYGGALQWYYQNGAPVGWQQYHITVYASSHPWEDWAETWAHYLHMMDTLETAWSFGLSVKARNIPIQRQVSATLDTDPYEIENFREIITQWLPFTYAMNSINRSMGINDLYPFVMSDWVITKLDFIHRVCRAQRVPPKN